MSGSYRHALLICLIPPALGILTWFIFPGAERHLSIGSTAFLVGLVRDTLLQSFGALSVTLLYFDLRAREG